MTAPTPPSGDRLVAITGSSGLIGAALSEALRGRGDQVLHLVRRAPRASGDLPHGIREARWQPGAELDPAILDGVTGAVNLAGAGLFEGRWTDERKKELIGSRVGSTDTLARALAAVAAQHPDRQIDVVRALASELRRPALFPAPKIAMRLVLGQASVEVLNSARVLPTRLTAAGFTFDHPDLQRAAAWVVEELRWHR